MSKSDTDLWIENLDIKQETIRIKKFENSELCNTESINTDTPEYSAHQMYITCFSVHLTTSFQMQSLPTDYFLKHKGNLHICKLISAGKIRLIFQINMRYIKGFVSMDTDRFFPGVNTARIDI